MNKYIKEVDIKEKLNFNYLDINAIPTIVKIIII